MIRWRQVAFAIAGLALVGGAGLPCRVLLNSARADGAQPENEDSRFSFYRAEGGFLRLDGITGQVSICTRRPAGWLCEALPEEQAAFEAEIGRLERDNGLLKKELLGHGLPLPAEMRPDQGQDRRPRLQGTGEQEVRHIVSVIGGAWRWLIEMIEGVQRDLLKKS